MRRAATLAFALLALALPAGASAACQPRATLGEVEKEVMCPICGVPLELATESPQAQRERRFIETQVARCRSKEEIKQALAAQFGDEVLALPGDDAGNEDSSTDYLVYVIPALALLLAGIAIGLAVVRWRGRPEPRDGDEPPAPESAADSARLDADLDRYDL